MYILLAAIVLLLLFVASYGGRRTWVALASATLSVLLVAGCAFLANARSAGPYFNALAAEAPALFNTGLQDLAFAAERLAASHAQAPRRAVAATQAPPPAAPSADDGAQADWLDLSAIDMSWLDPSDWLSSVAGGLNPLNWFETTEPGKPEVHLKVQQGDETTTAAVPAPVETGAPQASQTPLPTVRSMMREQDEAQGQDEPLQQADTARQQAAAAPSYRILTPPEADSGPPEMPGAPVKWLADASAPDGMDKIMLTGTNTSNTPLENIQAVLKPDSDANALGIDTVALNLRVERRDGTAAPGASIPPGARFYLEAADLSEAAARQLGGAILSFAYSQDGRRRTSIMYLKRTALSGPSAPPQ